MAYTSKNMLHTSPVSSLDMDNSLPQHSSAPLGSPKSILNKEQLYKGTTNTSLRLVCCRHHGMVALALHTCIS